MDTKFLPSRYALDLRGEATLNTSRTFLTSIGLRRSKMTTETTPSEAEKLNLHIYLTPEGYEKVKKCAEYAVEEGFIEGHPQSNFCDYTQCVTSWGNFI
jgi:hypothetical protein